MKVTDKKRFAAVLLIYIVLFSLSFLLPGIHMWQLGLIALLLIVVFMSFLFHRCRGAERRRACALAVLAVAAACFSILYSCSVRTNQIDSAEALADDTTHTATGYVSEILYEKPYGSAYYIKLLSVDGKTYSTKISLSIPFSGELEVYDEISFSCIFYENEVQYDSYMKSRGVPVSAEAEDFEVTGTHHRDISYVSDRIGTWIAGNFEAYIGGDEAGFATALLTGNREHLDGQTRLAYQRLGISHILAVSGLHLSVIVGGADFLLRKLTIARRKKDIFLILLTFFFAMVCGFPASVMRAAIMLAIYYIGDLIGEQNDTFTSLAFAVALILSVYPYSVYDAGLWLSFLATLGIVIMSPVLDSLFAEKKDRRGFRLVLFRFLHFFAGLLMMTFAATFFTMPVTYLLYGGISLISPLANLIFVPLTELILYLLVLMTVFSFIPFVPLLLGSICRTLITFSMDLAYRISDMEGIYISIRYPFAGYVIAVLVIGILAVLFIKKLNPGWILAVFLVCSTAFGITYAVFHTMTDSDVKLYVESDGKNDVIGFVYEGKSILIDVGNGGYTVPSLAADTLSEYYECEIDLLVLTHLHSYHTGTLKKLADQIKIHGLLLPEAENDQEREVIDSILSALSDTCEISFYPRDGSSYLAYEGLKIHLPQYQTISRSAHPVIVFSAEIEGYAGTSFVYAGSSAFELEAVSALSQDTSVIVCGAHGPVTKNIFDASCFENTEYVVFADEDIAFYIETDEILSKILFLTEENGRIRFSFEK